MQRVSILFITKNLMLLVWVVCIFLNSVFAQQVSNSGPTQASNASQGLRTFEGLEQVKSSNPPQTSTSVIVIGVKGLISRQSLEKVESAIKLVRGGDALPASFIVLLDSPGGDGIAAMKIGHLLRQANAHVFVTGDCASACVLVLAGGVVRGAPAQSIGIHRGRVTVSDDGAHVLQEVSPNDAKAKVAMLNFEKQAKAYFDQMGISKDFFPAMQAYEKNDVRRLSFDRAKEYQLIGIEKNYLMQRTAELAQKGLPWPNTPEQLEGRTLRVASECAPFYAQHKAYINCYSRVLKSAS